MAAPQNFVSVTRRPPDVEDYIDILRRYRSWVIGPAFAGLVISVVAAFLWPDMYLCYASMQIKPGTVSDLIPSISAGHMAERLQELNLEILGRDNLVPMLQNPKLDIYKKERQKYTNEDVADQYFSKNVKIVPYASPDQTARGAMAFRIQFEYPDRTKARAVVLDLVGQFTSKNMALQSTQSVSRSTLMDDELKRAKDHMEQAQAAMATYAAENQGRLPEDAQNNSLEVTTKLATLNSLHDYITQEQGHLANLQASLSNNKNQQVQQEANLTTQQITQNVEVRNQNLTDINKLISAKKAEIEGMLKTYTPNFPAVQTARGQLKSLEDQRDAVLKEEASTPGRSGSNVQTLRNPQAEQALNTLRAAENDLRAQISTAQMNIQNKQAQEARAEKELRAAQDKVLGSPAVIQKYHQLDQDLQLARTEYDTKAAEKQKADTQKSVEEHQAGEQLDVLEQPVLPDSPVSPNRPAVIGLGTVIGLALGIALAGAKEIKDTSLKNLKDVRAYTNLPVLSSIPLLENALLMRRKRRLAWLAWSSAVIIGSILMSGAVYYYFTAHQQIS